MKKKILYYAFAIVFMVVVYASASRVSAQTGDMTGGYSDAAVNSKETKKFAKWAVKARAKSSHKPITLVKIVKAENQVVRGMNHRICMDVREGKHKTKRVTAVVWEDINDRPLKLTDWKAGGCKDL